MAKAKAVIKQYDPAAVAAILKREIPDLKISSITIIETGWDHLVAALSVEPSPEAMVHAAVLSDGASVKSEVSTKEDDWIFRFPRTEGSIANLEREKQLLEYLKNYITLPIPHYQYSGTNTAFVGYRKIPGIHLDQYIYAGLGPADRQNIANTFAQFFTELHHAVSIEQALQWGYTCIIRPSGQMIKRYVQLFVKQCTEHRFARTSITNNGNFHSIFSVSMRVLIAQPFFHWCHRFLTHSAW